MATYLVRRILLMFPTLVGITLVVFVVMASSPGGISAQALIEGQNLEPQAKKALEDYYNRLYGLDRPAPEARSAAPSDRLRPDHGDVYR